MAILNFYSVWPLPVCLLLLYLFAATPIFNFADAPPSVGKNRFKTLDGLRGLLASCVVVEHVEVYHRYLRDGTWAEPPTFFYDKLGRGVGLFFIMTGYLFWMYLLRKQGRVEWPRLYISRVLRIGPVYLFAAVLVIVVVATKTKFHVLEPLPALTKHLASWLALGIVQGKSLNATNAWILLAGVNWTLQFEWGFYLSLPLIALAARLRKGHHWVVFGVLIACLIGFHFIPRQIRFPFMQIELFIIGMAIASLENMGKLPQLPLSVASVVALASAMWAFTLESSTPANLLMGVAFYLVISGADLFGMLRSRAAVRLGDISYGIYLLQGLVLALVFSGRGKQIALDSPAGHWSLCIVCLVLTALFALFAHWAVELPAIELGKKLAEKKRA